MDIHPGHEYGRDQAGDGDGFGQRRFLFKKERANKDDCKQDRGIDDLRRKCKGRRILVNQGVGQDTEILAKEHIITHGNTAKYPHQPSPKDLGARGSQSVKHSQPDTEKAKGIACAVKYILQRRRLPGQLDKFLGGRSNDGRGDQDPRQYGQKQNAQSKDPVIDGNGRLFCARETEKLSFGKGQSAYDIFYKRKKVVAGPVKNETGRRRG